MFNKYVEISKKSRFENEDHFKIARLAETYKKSGMIIEMSANDKTVEIKFITKKSCVKSLTEQLDLLIFIGIEAEMKIK